MPAAFDRHAHRAGLGRMEHAAAGVAINLLDRPQVVAAVAADDRPAGRAPGGQGGRLALPAAVMRDQQHVAVRRLLGQHVVQPRRRQVAGQQDAVLPAIDQQDEAVGVVAAEDALPRRVEDFEGATLAGREIVVPTRLRAAACRCGRSSCAGASTAGLCFSNICGVT